MPIPQPNSPGEARAGRSTGGGCAARQAADPSSPNRARASKAIALAGLLGGLASVGTLAGTAVAQRGSDTAHLAGHSAVVKPDFGYFAGKTITFITPGAAGGFQQVDAQVIGSGIASYLHCNVNVEDIPAGGSVPAQNTVASAAPNGLTIGWLGVSTDVLNKLTNVPGINFDPRQESVIAAIPAGGDLLMSRPGDGFPTLNSVLKARSTFNMANATTGTSYIASVVFSGVYGLKSHFIYGYANATTQLAGFERGDAPVEWTAISTAQPLIVARQVIPLLQYAPAQKGFSTYPFLKNIPTVSNLLASDPPKSKAGVAALKEAIAIVNAPLDTLIAPAGTPRRLVMALTDATRSTLAQSSVKTDELNVGQPIGYIPPAQASANIDAEIAHAPILLRYLEYQYP